MSKKIKELRERLYEEAMRAFSTKLKPNNANAAANLAEKLLTTIKLEIQYNQWKGNFKEIGFMEYTE